MPLLVIFLIWYFVVGRNNPRIYNFLEGKLKTIITFLMIITFAPVFIGGIGGLIGLSVGLVALLASIFPFLLPIFIIRAVLGKDKNKHKRNKKSRVRDEEYLNTGLAKSVPKRRKIVKKFNKRFDLNLTEDEINRIVDASYMSFAWEKEIKDMDADYDSVYEWYKGMTNWLRAYLKAFPVHTVSSDFTRQKEVCIDTFDQLLTEINPSLYSSIEECIEDINNKYYCMLDENTFMILYRFLQANGKNHKLPTSTLYKNESDIDILKKKYDQTADANFNEQSSSERAASDLARMRMMR